MIIDYIFPKFKVSDPIHHPTLFTPKLTIMIFRKFTFQKFTTLLVLILIGFNNQLSGQFINYQGHGMTSGLVNAPDQTIWANAGNGLLHYDLNGNLIEVINRTSTGDLATPTSMGSDITIAPNGDIWTAGGFGPIRHYDGNTWTIFDNNNTPEVFNNNSISIIEAGPNGAIYAISHSEISVYQNNEWQTFNLGVFSNGMNAAGFSPSGELTLALGRGLATWTAEFGIQFIVGGPNFTGDAFYDFQYLENGDLYYTTSNKGVYHIPSGSTNPILIATADEFFPRLAVESDGTIWVGTFAQGGNLVQRWTGNSWITYNQNNSTVSSSAVSDILVDANDNVFLSQGFFSDDEGLQRFDGNNWEVKYEGFITQGNNNDEHDFDDAGNVYTIGGRQLISKLNPATGVVTHFHRGNSPIQGTVFLRSLTATGPNQFWVGTENHGIFYFNGNSWTQFTSSTTNGQIPSNNIEAIKGAPDGTIYAIARNFSPTTRWLLRFQPNTQTWTNFIEGDQLPEDLNKLYVDNQGVAWITSFNGLSKFENNTFTVYTPSNSGILGSYSDFITGRPDGSEILFRGTDDSSSSSSYFTFDGQTFEEFGNGGINGTFSPSGDYFFSGLSRFDGSITTQYNSNNSFILNSFSDGGILTDPTSGVWNFNEIGVTRYAGDDNNPLTINLTSTDISCHDANDGSLSISVSGGTPPYQILFDGDTYVGNAFTFNNLSTNFSAGITVIDANGITTGGTARIINPSLINPNIIVSETTISTNAFGGIPPYNYLWSDGSTNTGINNAAPGNYTVTITDSNGCTGLGSVAVDNMPNEYCSSQGDQPWQSWIHTVFIDGINNSSGKSQYSDFTSQTSTVLRTGTTREITLVADWSFFTWDLYWRVWIDYNQNGIFENSEIAVQTITNAPPAPGGPTPVFANITIPQSAALGATRMRVSMKEGAFSTPCETFAVGEVEDYTVVIEEGTNGPICPITGTTSNFTCDDNGTPNNPGDDLFYFDATITATTPNPNSQWLYFNNAYPYNVPVNLGPFPIAEGDEILFIRDINSTNANSCEFNLFVELPIGPCSNGTPPPPPTGDCDNNLLTNAGFEDGLNDWHISGNANATSTNVRTGNSAAELGNGSSRIFRSFETSVDNTFTLMTYLRSENGDKNAGISIKYMSSSYQPILNETDYFSVGNTYTLFEKTETAPANTAFIEISIRGFGDGNLYADDVCLTNGDVTPPPPPMDQPDLQVAFVGGNYSGDPGAVAEFTFDLINAGTTTATESYRIGFVLSTDATLSSDDVFTGEVPTGNTGVGTISDIGGAITIPANMAAGNYFLIAKADFDEVISESNEDNNLATQAFTINGTITPPPPTGEPNCEAESDFPWHEWVSNVEVNGTENASGKRSYSDFTDTFLTFTNDNNNSINLTATYSYVTADAYWRVYNQNDIFEASEIFFEQMVPAPESGSGVTSTASGTGLSIPDLSLSGDGVAKMRVILSRDGFAEACGNIAFGEVEDYSALLIDANNISASTHSEENLFVDDRQLLNLTPNPTTDQVRVGLEKVQGETFELMIVNQLGQVVFQQEFSENSDRQFTVSILDFPSGVYFVWLSAEEKRSIPQKLIKQKF